MHTCVSLDCSTTVLNREKECLHSCVTASFWLTANIDEMIHTAGHFLNCGAAQTLGLPLLLRNTSSALFAPSKTCVGQSLSRALDQEKCVHVTLLKSALCTPLLLSSPRCHASAHGLRLHDGRHPNPSRPLQCRLQEVLQHGNHQQGHGC